MNFKICILKSRQMDDINKTISEFIKSMSNLPIEDLVTLTIQTLKLALLEKNNQCTILQSKLISQQKENKEKPLEQELGLQLLKDELSTYYGYNNTEILKGTFFDISMEIYQRIRDKRKFIQQFGGPPAIKDIPTEYKRMDIDGNIIEWTWNFNDLRAKYYIFSEIQIPDYNKQKLTTIDVIGTFWHSSSQFNSFIRQKQTNCKYDVYKIIVYVCYMYILPSIEWKTNNKYKIYYTQKGFYADYDRWIKTPLHICECVKTIIWKDNDTLYNDLIKCNSIDGIAAIIVTKVEPINEDKKNEETCAVCCDTIVDPVYFSCMHKYCKKCVNDLLKHNTKKCPLCRTDIQIIRITDLHSS